LTTTSRRKTRTRKAPAQTVKPTTRTKKVTEAPKVIITEDIRPETLLKFEDYKRDFKLRWDIHLYEWNALLVDLRKAYDFSKPYALKSYDYCKDAYNRAFPTT